MVIDIKDRVKCAALQGKIVTAYTQELDHTPPYKDTMIYKKPAFKCQR